MQAAAPNTTEFIVVPASLLPVMHPFLKGISYNFTVEDLHYWMDPLHLANAVQWLGLTGLYRCSLTPSCLHTTHMLLVNSATLCIRQWWISPQLCHMFLLLSLANLQTCCLRSLRAAGCPYASGLQSTCQLHLKEGTVHWQADTQPY